MQDPDFNSRIQFYYTRQVQACDFTDTYCSGFKNRNPPLLIMRCGFINYY